MKILLNGLQAGNRSGTGRYTVELARRLAAREDVDLRLVWPRAPQESAPPFGMGDETLTRRASRALPRLLYDQIGIRREARQWAADLVHFPANIGPIATMGNAVLTIHDLSFYRDPSWFKMSRAIYYRTAVGQSAHSAARIIADSRATADDVHAYLGIPNQRIDVAPLGVDEHFARANDEAVAQVIERYKLPAPFFLFVGTIEPRKNVARLVRAWDKVARDLDHGLVIAGRDGWKTGEGNAAMAGVSQPERLRRLGFVAYEDLPALYSAAAAFVWPSLWEGFGLPPLEAMACGCPVVTSNVSSLPEVCGDAALLIDPQNEAALVQAMLRVVRDEKLRAQLVEAGAARAAMFTWDRTAEATVGAYRAALGSSE